jgi:lathosterol oxidase
VLAQTLGLANTVPGILAVQIVFGMILYFGLSGLSYWYFFVWRKEHYFPGEEKPDFAEMKKAMRLAVWGVIGNAVFALPFHYAIFHGYGKVYYSVAERGWGYYAFSFFVFLAVTETCIYWIHRWLHHPWLYKHLHLYHHEYRKPTPWVSMAFHPLDSFAQAVPHYMCAMLFPVHFSIYAGFVTFVMLWTFFIHDRVSWVRVGIVNYTAHHTLHHIYNKYNYGQFLTVWDRLGGSYRDPKTDGRYAVMHPAPKAAAAHGAPALTPKQAA